MRSSEKHIADDQRFLTKNYQKLDAPHKIFSFKAYKPKDKDFLTVNNKRMALPEQGNTQGFQ
jgi:hypothetical protein